MTNLRFEMTIPLQIENLAALFASRQLGIGLERCGRLAHRVARVVETDLGFEKIIAAFLAGPDKPVDFFFAAFALHHVSPRTVRAPR